MKNKIKVMIIVLVLMATVLGAFALYRTLGDKVAPPQSLGVNEQTYDTQETKAATNSAPDFTVYDKDGNEVKLSDFFGKPIVLNFWASWCSPCKAEMPGFEEKYKETGDSVQFLIVNMTDNTRETVDVASEFIASQGYTFPVYYDTAQSAAIAYSVYSLPTTYFIDAQGNLVTYASGAIDSATLQKGIDMITK